ncbi:hypothetical protein [Ensifer canadensis]
MLLTVDQEHNRENFLRVYGVVKHLNAFPFFGTLLGLTRENDILSHDDDVDFYVDMKHRDELIVQIRDIGFELDENVYPNTTQYFLQGRREIDGVVTFVDFYLYEDQQEWPYILDRWNFPGVPEDEAMHLRVDKSAVFPLTARIYFGVEVMLPANPEECCRFLYGDEWRQKRSKADSEYRVVLHNYRPVIATKGGLTLALLDERAALQEENRKLVGNNERLAEEALHLLNSCNDLRTEIDDLHAERDRLTIALASAKHEIELNIAAREGLHAQLDHQKREAQVIITENSRLLTAYSGMLSYNAHLEKQLREVTDEKDHLGSILDEKICTPTALTQILIDNRLPILSKLAEQKEMKRLSGIGFNSEVYLSRNLDVHKTGMNALLHFVRYGRREGRRACFY